jgi:hypothetical protein
MVHALGGTLGDLPEAPVRREVTGSGTVDRHRRPRARPRRDGAGGRPPARDRRHRPRRSGSPTSPAWARTPAASPPSTPRRAERRPSRGRGARRLHHRRRPGRAADPRRADRLAAMAELPPEVRALFEGANFVHLATLNGRRLPPARPRSGPATRATTSSSSPGGSLKARNMARRPRVAISVTRPRRPVPDRPAPRRPQGGPRLRGGHALADELALRYTGEPFPYKPPTSRKYVVEVHKVRSTQLPFEHRPSAA